jgi:hypothetical protein
MITILSKNIFAKFFTENIFKIVTSVPASCAVRGRATGQFFLSGNFADCRFET